ncbi:hypothetical protein FE633_08315 [Streptomyces montanus]|uniref:Uncharacterized protein n=1 Tax=Streptomyces montanus TaxID=2580423 RepID=A0A5R9G122_9ACTN|nr:hypothetical protein FE633_08315 [Streptomyces montanus]
MRAAAFSSPPFFVSKPRAVSDVSRGLCPTFPEQNEEVADGVRSYESTRRALWPANSFMVSVTDPAAGRRCVLTSFGVNRTRAGHEEESGSWTSFAPPAGRRRSPRRPSTPPLCRSRVAPM